MKGIKFISVLIFTGMISGLAAAQIQRRNALEEVTVTAQKWPKLLQETAIAMSVLTSEQLELQGITSLGDMHGGAIASLRMFASGDTPSNLIVAIRGNGTGDPSEITRDGSVSVYLDGVYMARSQGLAITKIYKNSLMINIAAV
jgi:iron complex outermembrane receptor protein